MTVPARPFRSWSYGGIDVSYFPGLDGAGMALAANFIAFVRDRTGGRRYPRAFEWCAGPGFLGFALLAEGLCDELHLADIAPVAAFCVADTVRANGLEGRVTFTVSDNFSAIPPGSGFDMVIGNPPSYARLNPRHRYYEYFQGDPRPNDPDWRVHRGFYEQVAGHLNPGAPLFISEVEPYQQNVFIDQGEEPYDARERPAIEDLLPMISAGGLVLDEVTTYHANPGEDLDFYMMVSHLPSGGLDGPSPLPR